MNVTVFGGSKPLPGEPAYNDAYRLGELLGQAGHTVLTGGYIGTMEAVSRGAAEVGGHVIGVTCDEIEAWRPVSANAWVKAEVRQQNLINRISFMINECQAALALPGGVGTLTEVTLMWNLMLIRAVSVRPLILIGDGWLETFDGLFTHQNYYIPETQRGYLQFSSSVEQANQMLLSMTGWN